MSNRVPVPVRLVTLFFFIAFMIGAAAGMGVCSYASRRTLASIAAAHESERADWQAQLDLARGQLADAQRANRALAAFAVAEHKQLAGEQSYNAAVIQQWQSDVQAAAAVPPVPSTSTIAAASPAGAADPTSALLALAAKLLLRQ